MNCAGLVLNLLLWEMKTYIDNSRKLSSISAVNTDGLQGTVFLS